MLMITNSSLLLILALVAPLCGAIVAYSTVCLGSSNRYINDRVSGWIATAFAVFSCFICFFLSSHVFLSGPVMTGALWGWIDFSSFRANIGFRMDELSAVMSLVVTGIGSLIHLYAIGYMAHDSHCPRFFAYLNLFLFSMLTLVLADNMLLLFVGWEGVGLCSYLLIGFWFSNMSNSAAGQKAFVVNRIGDAGLLLGICTLIVVFGAVEFEALRELVPIVAKQYPFMIELTALLLLAGAIGKSAQVPLHIWLPDAMAGPTPVSALIHAATMVTAGIYLISRLSFLFELAPNVMAIILIIGTVTAFFGATVALVQNDIKKVLAYSTLSQLGYMFMGLGVGAFSYSIYHVVTHAFFKACLFMGAGSVIVACHHNQDMRMFGGLYKRMPVTFISFLLASLALAGCPMTSGHYSKDRILWAVMNANHGSSSVGMFYGVNLPYLCWYVGVFTVFLTGFYIIRTVMLTFFGEYMANSSESNLCENAKEPQESSLTMIFPLALLGIGSVCFSFFLGEGLLHALKAWTRDDMIIPHASNVHLHDIIVSSVGIFGMFSAFLLYGPRFSFMPSCFCPAVIARATSVVYKLFCRKWYFDEIFDFIIIRPLKITAQVCYVYLDRLIIDRSIEGIGLLVQVCGGAIRRMQNGQVALYGVLMLAGSLCLTIFLLLGN